MENECFDNKIIHPMWTHWKKKFSLWDWKILFFFFHFNNKKYSAQNFSNLYGIYSIRMYIEENEEKTVIIIYLIASY